MSNIIVYSKTIVFIVIKQSTLLKALEVKFEEKKMESFDSVDDMIKDIGKRVRSMPQIKIDGELVGGYNQLIEHYNKEVKVDFKVQSYTMDKDKNKFENVILFPENKIKKETYACWLQKKMRDYQTAKFVETSTDKLGLDLIREFVGMQLDTKQDNFTKDLALVMDAIRGLLYR